jgi:hypothetical protein
MNDSTSDSPVIQIPLTRGYTAIVSPEDADLISKNWQASPSRNTFYATTWSGNRAKKNLTMHGIIMHRVLGRPLAKGEMIDHKDQNGLNNLRSNLRIATDTQNKFNRGAQKNNTSGYKGVHKVNDRWSASIGFQGKTISLGTFDSPLLAAVAYNQAAKEYFGEFAWLNPIDESDVPLSSTKRKMRTRQVNNSSGYKGVSWDKKTSKWQAYITINSKMKALGRFAEVKDAVRAYNAAALLNYGDEAYLNPIED